jgi:hypothetical protein
MHPRFPTDRVKALTNETLDAAVVTVMTDQPNMSR